MQARKLLALPLLLPLFLPTVAKAQAKTAPPTVVVRVNSIDSVIDHVKFLTSLAGQKDAARQIEALIKAKIGDKGLEGVDSSKPFGMYGRVGKELDDVSGAILVPIADEKAFLNLLNNLNVQAAKGTDGIYAIKTNTLFDAYLRFANKYAYITALNPAALEDKKLLDPAKVLAGKPTSAFSLTIQLDQVPDAAKLITTAQAEQVLREAQEQKIPGESEAQRAFRIAALKEALRLIATVLKDGKELYAEVDLNQKSGDLSATFSISGVSGSELDTGIHVMAKNSSLFAGLLKPGAAVNGFGHVKLPQTLAAALGEVIDEARATALGSIQAANKKQEAEAFFKAITPTFKSGDFDGAGVVLSNGKHLTIAGAFKVKGGDELGQTVRKLASEVPNAKIKLDIDAVGATKIHMLEVPDRDLAEPFKMTLGEANLYVAFRNDAVFFSLGKDGLQAIKDAIPVKATTAGPMLFYEVDVARLAFLAPPDQVAKAKELFPGGQGGIVRLTVEGGAALTVHLKTKVSVLQFLGQAHERKAGTN